MKFEQFLQKLEALRGELAFTDYPPGTSGLEFGGLYCLDAYIGVSGLHLGLPRIAFGDEFRREIEKILGIKHLPSGRCRIMLLDNVFLIEVIGR